MSYKLIGSEIGHSSYKTYGYSMLNKSINPAKVKTAFVDIPMGSGFYDFSAVGGIKYEQRTVTYTFTKVYSSLINKANGERSFCEWILGAEFGTKLTDDFLLNMVGAGTFDRWYYGRPTDISIDDDVSLKSTITVEFTIQPYIYDNNGNTVSQC